VHQEHRTAKERLLVDLAVSDTYYHQAWELPPLLFLHPNHHSAFSHIHRSELGSKATTSEEAARTYFPE
jgi:hypothetical protein